MTDKRLGVLKPEDPILYLIKHNEEKMKYLLLMSTILLSACSSVEDYFTGTSVANCYGLGTPECVREGYRESMDDLYMHREMTVDELERLQENKR